MIEQCTQVAFCSIGPIRCTRMNDALTPAWRTALIACSLLALLAVLLGRGLAPSDTDDKDQPITMTYTVNMIEHGEWIVPRDHRGNFTTKPLLYNWLAAPAVWIAGVENEFAHKLPSVLALIGCFALLVWLGQRIEGGSEIPGALGWLAGMIFLANYTIFQLGYLARTDMLLTFWLLLGWVLATRLIAQSAQKAPHGNAVPDSGSSTALPCGAIAAAFWACVALAALTKGPPALVLVIYALIAPRVLAGRWSATSHFGWWWGLPLALLPAAAWVYGVWVQEPEHLVNRLWGEEVFGRVTGLGDEGNRRGPVDFFFKLFHMPLYYLSRFLPWSILSIFAMIELYRRQSGEQRPTADRLRWWLNAAVVMLIIVIAFFSLSTGKRAAYIASVYGPGALLAAWWVLHIALGRIRHVLWLVLIATAAVMITMIVHRWVQFA